MSARNRELANLVVVGILTGVGFASVYIAQKSIVSTASLGALGDLCLLRGGGGDCRGLPPAPISVAA